MRKPPRIAVFLAILAAVGVWVALDNGPERAPVAARDSSPGEGGHGAAPAASDIRAELPSRTPLQRPLRTPFSPQSWTPPPPRRPVVSTSSATAPAPTVPPLPYRYVGEL